MNIIDFDFGLARDLAGCVRFLIVDCGDRFDTLDALYAKVITLCQMDGLAADEKWAESAKNIVRVATFTLGLSY